MGSTSEKREFNRFPVEFDLEISATDPKGNDFYDRTVLTDISVDGAKFKTQMGKKYFSGQILRLIIQLPKAGDTSAFLKGNATVIWVKAKKNQDPHSRQLYTEIAVKLESHLNFGRI
jgi:hypothetical protein